MDVPALVRDRLDGESVLTRVPLGGDDAMFVTPSRTLVYRSDGLLSDESVAAYPHDVERVDVSEGRRKATLELTYVDDTGSFTVPVDRLADVLEPVLGGALRANGILEADEAIREVYRFSELTLVVADGRLLKHVGSVFWDEEYEAFPFADVSGLDTEEGSVATGLVVEVDGRPERVKVPSDEAPLVRRTLEEAVLSYHDVDSVAELRETAAGESDEVDAETETASPEDSADTFDDGGIDPLVDATASQPVEPDAEPTGATSAAEPAANDPAGGAEATAATEAGGTADGESEDGDDDPFVSPAEAERLGEDASARDPDLQAVIDRLDALEAAVERQSERIDRQRATIRQLVEELRRGR